MRQSVYLFMWLLALAVAAAAIVLVAWRIFDYVFVPLPYHDPEPPVTLAGPLTRYR
jgi:hypothetical protein